MGKTDRKTIEGKRLTTSKITTPITFLKMFQTMKRRTAIEGGDAGAGGEEKVVWRHRMHRSMLFRSGIPNFSGKRCRNWMVQWLWSKEGRGNRRLQWNREIGSATLIVGFLGRRKRQMNYQTTKLRYIYDDKILVKGSPF